METTINNNFIHTEADNSGCEIQCPESWEYDATNQVEFRPINQRWKLRVEEDEVYSSCFDGKSTVFVSGPREELLPRLHYLAELPTEGSRQIDGRARIHGAAVRKPDGSSVLIFGDKGAGKTSISGTLCREYGCALIGNDQLIIGQFPGDIQGMQVVGDQKLTIRQYSPLAKLIPGLTFPEGKNPYQSKVTLYSDELLQHGIQTTGQPSRVLEKWQVKLLPDYTGKIIVSPLEHPNDGLRLHENLQRVISGITIPLSMKNDGEKIVITGFMPSVDTPQAQQRRNCIRQELLESTLNIAGRLHDICDHLMR